MPFLMAGDPDLDHHPPPACWPCRLAGADLIELGIPYSDPLADGPVIQAAARPRPGGRHHPGRGAGHAERPAGASSPVPVMLFTYSNPLLNKGMERLLRAKPPPPVPLGWWCPTCRSRKPRTLGHCRQPTASTWCCWWLPPPRPNACTASMPPAAASLTW
jgi:hypothetical protein